jgi:hypothetical protein
MTHSFWSFAKDSRETLLCIYAEQRNGRALSSYCDFPKSVLFNRRLGTFSLTVRFAVVYFFLIKSYTKDSPKGLSRKGLVPHFVV